jgi:1,4-dihydroxy-2-naphthoyl-CoA hydrolase
MDDALDTPAADVRALAADAHVPASDPAGAAPGTPSASDRSIADARSAAGESDAPVGAQDAPAGALDAPAGGPGSIDGVSGFMGMRWDDPQTVRLQIRPELINAGGLLSGVVTYALVDYCMGSTLWAQTTAEERIATIGISINYVQTATEGEIVCTTTLDRRNRTTAVMHSEVRHEDGRLLVTAIGSYTIFPRRRRAAPRPG